MTNNDIPTIPDVPTPTDSEIPVVSPLSEEPTIPTPNEPAHPTYAAIEESAIPAYGTPIEYGQPPAPPQGGLPVRKLLIILAIVAVLALAVFLGMGPIRQAMVRSQLKNNPKAAITQALEKSRANIKGTPSIGPDFMQFYKEPTEQNLTLGLGGLLSPGSNPGLANSMVLDLSLNHNPKKEEMMTTFSFTSPYFKLKESQLFLSPTELLLSFPMIYSDHEYITMNPATFPKDWNESEYASDYYTMDEEIDLPGYIHQLFGVSPQSDKTSKNEPSPQEELTRISDKLKESLEYSYLDETSEGFQVEVVAKKQDLQQALASLLAYLDGSEYSDMFNPYTVGSSFYPLDSLLGSTGSVLRQITVTDDATFLLSINKKSLQLTGIELTSARFSSLTTEETFEITFDLSLLGKQFLSEDLAMKIDFTAVDEYYQTPEQKTVAIDLTHQASKEKSIAKSTWEATLLVDGESALFYSDFSWDKAKKENNNMAWEMGVIPPPDSYSQTMTILFDGQLTEQKGAIHLTDGKISLGESSDNTYFVDVDYTLESAPNKSIHPNSKDVIDFFDVDWDVVLEGLSNLF